MPYQIRKILSGDRLVFCVSNGSCQISGFLTEELALGFIEGKHGKYVTCEDCHETFPEGELKHDEYMDYATNKLLTTAKSCPFCGYWLD